MTELLQKAIAVVTELSKLPEQQQDELALKILQEVDEIWRVRVLSQARQDVLRGDGTIDIDVLCASWNWTEYLFHWLFTNPNYDWFQPMYGLIMELRRRGYDQHFRAGQ